MTTTETMLIALLGWWLLIVLAMALQRAIWAGGTGHPLNAFDPAGRDVGAFGGRLNRVHANNYENIPALALVLLFAVASERTGVTDPLAPWLVAARIAQNLVHLASTAVPVVLVRFGFFFAQLALVAVALVGFLG